jgi:26S proteasome regulatory subunit N6
LLQQKQPTKALSIIDDLLKELKKLDDKQMLTETHLTEARIYHSLQNIPKCKNSLLLLPMLYWNNILFAFLQLKPA